MIELYIIPNAHVYFQTQDSYDRCIYILSSMHKDWYDTSLRYEKNKHSKIALNLVPPSSTMMHVKQITPHTWDMEAQI